MESEIEGPRAYNILVLGVLSYKLRGIKMGWRSKLIFLLVVYFAGFATAIYYLAPSGREGCQAGYYSSDDGSQGNTGVAVKDFCNKAYAKASVSLSNVDWQALKEKLNLGIQKLIEAAKNSRNSAAGESEDK